MQPSPIIDLDFLRDSVYPEAVLRTTTAFEGLQLGDVNNLIELKTVDLGDRNVRIGYIPPIDGQEPEETFGLALPYLNDIDSAPQIIRAVALHRMINPASQLIVFPNNGHKNSAYTLTPEEKARLANGDMAPIGEIWHRALEKLNSERSLGKISLTGYSQGALTALAIASSNWYRLDIQYVNADEAPSETGRTPKQLQKAFTAGGAFDVPNEARQSEIDVLAKAQNELRFMKDIGRFARQSLRSDAVAIKYAMCGDVNELVAAALKGTEIVKLGYVDNSPMFDPESISNEGNIPNVDIVGYTGGLGHGTGDNAVKHALMAMHGFDLLKNRI